MKPPILCALFGACSLLVQSSAYAGNLGLDPGGYGWLGYDASPRGGTLLDALTATVQDSPGLAFTATLTTQVYASDPYNPLGGLTFWYDLTNVSDPATDGGQLQVLALIDPEPLGGVEVNSESGGPVIAGLNYAGNLLVAFWQPGLTPGDESPGFVLYSSLASYHEGLARVESDAYQTRSGLAGALYGILTSGLSVGTAEHLPAFVPGAAQSIPETTTTLSILLLAALGCGSLLTRSRNATN